MNLSFAKYHTVLNSINFSILISNLFSYLMIQKITHAYSFAQVVTKLQITLMFVNFDKSDNVNQSPLDIPGKAF